MSKDRDEIHDGLVPIKDVVMELAVPPGQVIDSAVLAAKKLKSVVSQSRLSVKIGNKEYLQFEAWQTLARFYGVAVKTSGAEPVEIHGVPGAKAKADVITKEGIVIGGAEAYCMMDERNWKGKPWFQVASMAQTRAAAKALRNVLSWVAVLAGYTGTPAEEMTGEETFNHQPEKVIDVGPSPASSTRTSYKGNQPDEPATDKQQKAIYAIFHQKDPDGSLTDYLDKHYGIQHTKHLTKSQASDLITELQDEA